jgi:sugar phosphate isomerase/epimerase
MNTDSVPATRRDFLARTALAAAGLTLGAGGAQAAGSKKKAAGGDAAPKPPAGPREPTCIHVFAKPLQWLSYEDAAALAAEAGYGGIEFAVRPGGHVLPEKVVDDLPRAVEAARKAGLKTDMIVTAVTDPADKFTEPLLRTAAKLGVKYYRLGYLEYDTKLGVWGSLQKHKPMLKDLAALNAQLGLHGAYQNHSGTRVGGPVWDLYELLRDLDPRWLGCQYDVRHATVEGGASWPVGLRLLAPWIRCTDIKDFKWEQAKGKGTVDNVPLGEGIVNFDQYFKLVRELNIGGPISVHLEYPPFERSKEQMAPAEKRAKFSALMRQDVVTLQGFLAKHQLA